MDAQYALYVQASLTGTRRWSNYLTDCSKRNISPAFVSPYAAARRAIMSLTISSWELPYDLETAARLLVASSGSAEDSRSMLTPWCQYQVLRRAVCLAAGNISNVMDYSLVCNEDLWPLAIVLPESSDSICSICGASETITINLPPIRFPCLSPASSMNTSMPEDMHTTRSDSCSSFIARP